ncbi:interleukin-17 receptor D isoform X1 [Clupea harengus]|uniref:Interleukin-17 receptor D isoform X1 n=1 Tax=Clupea harengus TaxID=7950 RepID=A0A6P3W0J6_CLUHA|nr:interleukin-17 receptor D isoform X1 [Clupea harengus]
MWRGTLTLCLSLLLHSGALEEQIHPQNCTLNCIRKGEPECKYCRITQDNVKTALGFTSPFGACVPWPCHAFLGETPHICQHYVHAPQNVVVEFLPNLDPKHETAIISWSPSKHGIAFLRGFQVSLHALGGAQVVCQLFLMQQNLSLTPAHTQMIYYSEPFPMLPLDTQYAVTVMALPVPEKWDRFYHKKLFSTITCPQKNGLEKCKKDWYPTYLVVEQDGHDINVTFNLAPPDLQLGRYLSSCYGGGERTYTALEPDLKNNNTQYTYRLSHLYPGVNYTCVIAADVVDAVKKKFFIEILPIREDTSSSLSDLILLISLLSLGVFLATTVAALIALCKRKRDKLNKKYTAPDICQQFHDRPEGQCVAVSSKSSPPSLLIVYSSSDGPAHVRVVLHLAAFLQRHMAIKVFLDLWESLSLMEDGVLGWYSRKIAESEYVLVICSSGLHHRPQEKKDGGKEEDHPDQNMSSAIVAVIGEELCRAKARGQDLSKYITANFEYSKETDVPAVMGLASHYTLTADFPLLFSHIHGLALQQPGVCLQIEHISEDYYKLPAGEALQRAILEAKTGLSEQHECEDMKGPTTTTTTNGWMML